MNTVAIAVIDHLGGTYAVAKMIEAPTSTVHSWRKNGIPRSRMAHLRLAAKDAGLELPADVIELQHASDDAVLPRARSTGDFSQKSSGVAA